MIRWRDRRTWHVAGSVLLGFALTAHRGVLHAQATPPTKPVAKPVAKPPAKGLTSIGATSAGTPVYLETKSVTRAGGIITATLRVGLQPTIKTAQGDMVSMRSIAMIDCANKTTATKERWFYFDEKGTKEARHDKPGKPGYGPALKGSLADVAIGHFCAEKR